MRYNGILHYGIILMLTTIVLWGCPKKSEITASPEVQKENVTSPATPDVAETGKNGKSASPSESMMRQKNAPWQTEEVCSQSISISTNPSYETTQNPS